MTGTMAITIVALGLTCFFGLRYYLSYRQFMHIQQKYSELNHQFIKIQAAYNQQSAELNEIKQQSIASSLHDLITNLPTRPVLEDRVLQTLHQSQRYQLTFAVLFLDIDNFKMINNVLGYQGGDQVLQEASNRFQACIRKVDTVCRFAGDGFGFLLPQLAKAETAAYVAQRLLDVLAKPFIIHDQEIYVTASIGISIYPTDGNDVDTLIKNAVTALQQAKLRGFSAYQFYRQEMYTLGRRELLLSSRLSSEAIFQELTLFYQPQFNVESKAIICMEALLRWQHPDFGLIGPHEFLLLAENNGRIVAIGDWVLKQACIQLQQWRSTGWDAKSIAINVSLRQLENPQFVHKVSQVLADTKVKPYELVLEISESILLPKFDLVEKTLNMLKHLGVKIAIDDFGTGFVSLQHLRRFPIDCLKIDGALSREISSNKESEAITKTIIALANSLGLTVVAEGVETEAQKNYLLELGCYLMQGHLFSHARLPQEFTTSILTDQNSHV